jgi:UDP-N-acetylglucosamine diphosphorylase / glucose-1-phosphate thymidylyltransferase / UDP-N-acetylgalactosamine diphosphorylase / glucosamine-1-phosphate N-acetyltransferase / galactosamine-1-phosphate N-acetyltransferase
MNIGLFEDSGYLRLLPLTWLRACFELRCGRDRLADKVRTLLHSPIARLWLRESIQDVVAERFALDPVQPDMDWCLLNARALLTTPVLLPAPGKAWRQNGNLIAAGVARANLEPLTPGFFLDADAVNHWLERFQVETPPESVRLITYPWDLVLENEAELRRQCQEGGVQDGTVYAGAHLVQPGQIHIARGARVKPGVVLDAEEGPIHIAENVLIQPNAVLEGPCYVGPGSVVRPGAALRAGTSLGPVCKVGGEVVSTIIQGYTSKQHDGFLGHSYVGEWVNLGADTVTSDLKNTYGTIRVSINGVGVESGQQFVGCFIGDHAKTAIGTVLPTGGVIGVASNVFTTAGVPKFVPSFAWLTDSGMANYRVDKAVQIARVVMGRRDVELSDAEQRLLEQTAEAARTVEAAGWA